MKIVGIINNNTDTLYARTGERGRFPNPDILTFDDIKSIQFSPNREDYEWEVVMNGMIWRFPSEQYSTISLKEDLK